MYRTHYLPDADRLSVLGATVLLAYALTNFVTLPAREFSIQLPGLFISFEINIRTFVAVLAGGLTASGADWLLRDHPALGDRTTYEHWLLPALTAWVIGLPLYNLPPGWSWWVLFITGGGALMGVLVAEYIVVDPEDIRYALASAVLTAVSFALFLILAIVLRSESLRLVFIVPALSLASLLVAARTLHLRLNGRWLLLESLAIALVVGQIAAALHYWPLSPVAYGLAVLGPAYALTSLMTNLAQNLPARQSLIEPGIVLSLAWAVAFWVR